MKRIFVVMTMAFVSLLFFASCEKAPEDALKENESADFIFVNGVKYLLRSTALTVDHGLYFKAYFNSSSYQGDEDELMVYLSMDGCDLNQEYDLSSNEDGGKKYLQVLFSNYEKDSYSVAMLGPKVLNIMRSAGKSETRDVVSAIASINKDEEGRFYANIVVDSDGLTLKLDWDGWIDDLND